MSRFVTLLAVLLLCAFCVSDSTAHQFPWGDGTPANGDVPDPDEDHPWGGDQAPVIGGEVVIEEPLDKARTRVIITTCQPTADQAINWLLDVSGVGLWIEKTFLQSPNTRTDRTARSHTSSSSTASYQVTR